METSNAGVTDMFAMKLARTAFIFSLRPSGGATRILNKLICRPKIHISLLLQNRLHFSRHARALELVRPRRDFTEFANTVRKSQNQCQTTCRTISYDFSRTCQKSEHLRNIQVILCSFFLPSSHIPTCAIAGNCHAILKRIAAHTPRRVSCVPRQSQTCVPIENARNANTENMDNVMRASNFSTTSGMRAGWAERRGLGRRRYSHIYCQSKPIHIFIRARRRRRAHPSHHCLLPIEFQQ